MTLLTPYQNKKILVLGAGISGLSCARFLASQGISFAVNDSRNNIIDNTWFQENFNGCQLSAGQWDATLIANADVIITSPGIDLSQAIFQQNIRGNCQVIGDVELFFQVVNSQQKQKKVIAVTGSNGKSTVVSLLAHIAKQLNIKAQLAGNIGTPIVDTLTRVLNDEIDYLILELSSFQLETLSSMKATVATILNVSDDHLDRHLNLETYYTIKQSIYQQTEHIVFNRDDKLTYPKTLQVEQNVTSFGSNAGQYGEFGLVSNAQGLQLMYADQALIPVAELPIAGIHNALNCLAALALGMKVNWPLDAMVAALPSFKGLAHRCEKIISNDGLHWINDSKATNVGATLAAITGIAQIKTAQQKLILIAGGDGKGADFSPLAKAISQQVNYLITLGKDGDKLAALKTMSTTDANIKVNSLLEAVRCAKKQAKTGDIILLSPACASLDMFSSFAERGECFIDAIKTINNEKQTKPIAKGACYDKHN
jgi:UDP-N-acetylmuramoylalanine--D-glutamate ligase